ncbi:30S ribosomal protein S18, chloroplastic [Smittium culicis]|uniref:Small ribosomal subunit protein bS18m n=1 Tax=Smittium culicis TaxID=133412 RepID=A0A1R1WYJ1_9FUNG|nr:30S ribosomal protein S18, chloroplastic [Smittium culicis]
MQVTRIFNLKAIQSSKAASSGILSRFMSTDKTITPRERAPEKAKFGKMASDQLENILSKTGLSELNRPNAESYQYTRNFSKVGTYHPWELNENKADLFPKDKKGNHVKDPFKLLEINPINEYKNTTLMVNYLTEMGRIIPRRKTGLSAKSQKRLSKAIKRARAFGLLPFTNKENINS